MKEKIFFKSCQLLGGSLERMIHAPHVVILSQLHLMGFKFIPFPTMFKCLSPTMHAHACIPPLPAPTPSPDFSTSSNSKYSWTLVCSLLATTTPPPCHPASEPSVAKDPRPLALPRQPEAMIWLCMSVSQSIPTPTLPGFPLRRHFANLNHIFARITAAVICTTELWLPQNQFTNIKT